MITETITWGPVSEPPNSNRTVLLYSPRDTNVPVWPGYFDDGVWFDAEGMPAGPVLWAEMPVGLKA